MRKVWAVAALLAMLAGCREKPKDLASETHPTAARPAPDFLLPDILSNETLQLSKMKGQVVVVDFWATWCPPCRMEIPGFVALQKKYGPRGLQVVGVSVDQGGSELVKKFSREWKINYKIVMDRGELAAAYGDIRSIPTTFVVGKDGNIVSSHMGYVEKAVFEKEILAALEVK